MRAGASPFAKIVVNSGGHHRLPLEKTHLRVTDMSQGCEMTPEWGLKNEAPARAYSAIHFSAKVAHRRTPFLR